MKVNVNFDAENNRYKVYMGDTVINTDSINIIEVDTELSETSENAVQNKLITNALINTNNNLDVTIARLDNLIENIGGDYTIIPPSDLATWSWVTYANPEEHDGAVCYGDSVDFTLPANTLVGIYLPSHSIVRVEHKISNGYTVDYTLGDINSNVGQFVLFNTGEWTTYRLEVDITSTAYQNDVINKTTLYAYGLPTELKDIRVDYFGFNHTTAGDSVRSIMEVIKTGNVYFNQFLEWGKVLDTIRTLNTITLPANTDIQVVLPSSCILTYYSGGTELGFVGDFASTETQYLTFSTGDYTEFSFVFSISPSTSVPDYHTKLDDLQLYYELDARLYNIMADRVATALSEALNTLNEATDTSVNNLNTVTDNNINTLNNVTNTNIDNLNNIADTGITNINNSVSNVLQVIGDNKTVALNDIANREGEAISNIANRESTAISNMANQESILAGNLNTEANNHITNLNTVAQQKMAELQNLSYTLLKTVTLSSSSSSLISLNASELENTNELLIYIDGQLSATTGAIGLTVNEEVLNVSVQYVLLHACLSLKKVIVDNVTYWAIEMNSSYNSNYLKQYDSLDSLAVSSFAITYNAGTKVTVLKR